MPRSIYTIEDRGNIYEVEADSPEQARAKVAKATAPGSGSAVYSDTRQPVTAGQERALQGMGTRVPGAPFAAGGLPAFAKPGEAAPTTGAYVDPRGSTVDFGAEPISKTLLAMGARTLSPRRLDGSQRPEAQSERLDAMQSGAMSGLLFGGKNELGALPEGMSSLLGGKGFSAGFDPALAASDERDRILRENHPLAYYGGGAAGTAATAAITPVVRGGTMAGRVLGNGGIQGAQGAAAGFLGTDGTMADRRAGALVGGVLGGVGGGVGGAIEPRVRPPQKLTALLESIPERERAAAAGRFRRIVPKKGIPDGAPQMTSAEAMGPRGKAWLGALARREGDTAGELEALLTNRNLGRSDRMLETLAKAAGISPEDAAGQLESMVARGRKNVAPLYEQGFANTAPMSSPLIDKLLARDAAKRGMNQARKIMSNEDVNPYTQGLTFMDNPDDWASQAGGLFNEQAAASPGRAAKAVARGDSLVTFLAKQGGLSDQGGELAGRNADLWHRDLPFRRRLISQTGLDMGDAAQRALDAGYFPELGRDGSISGSDLLSAIEGELRGKPRYSRELSGQGQDALGAAEAEARWGPQGQNMPGDMPEYGARPMPRSEPVFEQQPTTQGLDAVIRGLDTEIRSLPKLPNGEVDPTPYARSMMQTRKQLRDELNRLAEENNRNPAYLAAIRESGDYLGAQDAYNAAQRQLFSDSVTARDFAAAREGASAADLMYGKAGGANAIFNLAQKDRLAPKSLKTPIVRGKLETLYGKDGADSIASMVADEKAMLDFERRYAPGVQSITSEMLLASREIDQSPISDAAIKAGMATMTGGAPAGIFSLVRSGAQHLGDHVRTFGAPLKERNALGRVLMGGVEDGRALLNVPMRAPVRKAIQKGAHSALTRGSGRFGGWSAN